MTLIEAMEIGQQLNGIGLTIGSLIGYIAILVGIAMTVLILDTIVFAK